jgi:hypothetical protein
MKKIIILAICFLMKTSINAQIQSVHLMSVPPTIEQENFIKDAYKKVNKVMKDLGYPNCYYTLLKLSDSDTASSHRFAIIGHWDNDKVYKEIHNNVKFKDANQASYNRMQEWVKENEYRRFYEIKLD